MPKPTCFASPTMSSATACASAAQRPWATTCGTSPTRPPRAIRPARLQPPKPKVGYTGRRSAFADPAADLALALLWPGDVRRDRRDRGVSPEYRAQPLPPGTRTFAHRVCGLIAMNQHPDELHEHDALERITRPDVQPGEILGPEEQALRRPGCSWARCSTTCKPRPNGRKQRSSSRKPAPAGSATARGWGWLLALAAVLLVALGLAVLRGLGIGSGAAGGADCRTSGRQSGRRGRRCRDFSLGGSARRANSGRGRGPGRSPRKAPATQ